MGDQIKKRWIKKRHYFVRHFVGAFLHPYSKIRYGARIDKFKSEGKRQYCVLFNHQTAFDQFFVALSFRQHLYFVASEDIFSKGLLSSLLRYLVAPIPIKKQTTDIRAIIRCIEVAKEGGSIALAPEGNRTYSGRTEHMSPAIAPMVKKLGLPLVLYRIEGGYGVQPRWADNVRKGKIHAYASRVIEPEEYMQLSDEALFAIIQKELYVDESSLDGYYYHKNSAEYLDRVFYFCPKCGFSEFKSRRDIVECQKCRAVIRYLPTKKLECKDEKYNYQFVADWYDAQSQFVNAADPMQYTDTPIYTEKSGFFEVVPNKKKLTVDKNAKIELYGDRVCISAAEQKFDFAFKDVRAVTILGRNKVNVYIDNKIYQLKGKKNFNGLKYVHLYNRYSNVMKGEANGSFLGL